MTGGDKYQSYHDDLLEMFEEEGLIFNCEFRKNYSNTLKKHNLGHHNSDTSLLKDVKIINEQIKKDNLKIIRGMDEDTGNTCYMLVNRTTTPMSCWESLDIEGENTIRERKHSSSKSHQISYSMKKRKYLIFRPFPRSKDSLLRKMDLSCL